MSITTAIIKIIVVSSAVIAHAFCMEISHNELKKLNQHFLQSLQYEDITTLGNLLKHGADINCKNSGGTALHKLCQLFYFNRADPSAQYFIIEKMKFLLDQKADINAQDYWIFDTPLHIASLNNDMIALLKLFLSYGADLFKLNRFSQTLFHKMATDYAKRPLNDYKEVITCINEAEIARSFQFKNQKTIIEKIASQGRIKLSLLIFNRLAKIPKDIIAHIFSFMPEDLYNQKMVDNVLRNVSNPQHIKNIIAQVPLNWIKSSICVLAQEQNRRKVDNVIEILMQEQIQNLEKLLAVSDNMHKMAYQYFAKEDYSDYEQFIEFLNPENAEKNFSEDIKTILYQQLELDRLNKHDCMQ